MHVIIDGNSLYKWQKLHQVANNKKKISKCNFRLLGQEITDRVSKMTLILKKTTNKSITKKFKERLESQNIKVITFEPENEGSELVLISKEFFTNYSYVKIITENPALLALNTDLYCIKGRIPEKESFKQISNFKEINLTFLEND